MTVKASLGTNFWMSMGLPVKKGTFWFQNWQTETFHEINFNTIKKIHATECKPTIFHKVMFFPTSHGSYDIMFTVWLWNHNIAHSGITFSCRLIEKTLPLKYIVENFTGLIHSFEMDFFLLKLTLEKASTFYKIILIKPITSLQSLKHKSFSLRKFFLQVNWFRKSVQKNTPYLYFLQNFTVFMKF